MNLLSKEDEELLDKATPQQKAAVYELTRRGFSFLAHFGYINAEDILRGMDDAAANGKLYEYLRRHLGVA
jgi:hypothetical protein